MTSLPQPADAGRYSFYRPVRRRLWRRTRLEPVYHAIRSPQARRHAPRV